jgi:hypothetical protein
MDDKTRPAFCASCQPTDGTLRMDDHPRPGHHKCQCGTWFCAGCWNFKTEKYRWSNPMPVYWNEDICPQCSPNKFLVTCSNCSTKNQQPWICNNKECACREHHHSISMVCTKCIAEHLQKPRQREMETKSEESKEEEEEESKQKKLLAWILKGKAEAKDPVFKYSITPDSDDGGWYDAVQEARDHGIPIASFGDTSDKQVLHPGHLGYKFDYFWGREFWSSSSCWDDEEAREKDKQKAHIALFKIAHILHKQGKKVWIVLPNGNDKGYLSTFVLTPDEWTKVDSIDNLLDQYSREDVVLFCFH